MPEIKKETKPIGARRNVNTECAELVTSLKFIWKADELNLWPFCQACPSKSKVTCQRVQVNVPCLTAGTRQKTLRGARSSGANLTFNKVRDLNLKCYGFRDVQWQNSEQGLWNQGVLMWWRPVRTQNPAGGARLPPLTTCPCSLHPAMCSQVTSENQGNRGTCKEPTTSLRWEKNVKIIILKTKFKKTIPFITLSQVYWIWLTFFTFPPTSFWWEPLMKIRLINRKHFLSFSVFTWIYCE